MRLRIFGAGLAALAWLAISVPAGAADLRPVYKGAPRPVANFYNWTGFYVGLNGGYGWGSTSWDFTTGGIDPSGWLFGITAGYNMQINNFILGIEGDYDWADIKASGTCGGVACSGKSTYLATVRGRLGYGFDRFMLYFTGGAAFSRLSAVAPVLGFGFTSDRIGWTIGGGLEYAFTGRWSAKLEYLYVDLGTFDSGFLAPAAVANVGYTENIFRIGLNYHFTPTPLTSRY